MNKNILEKAVVFCALGILIFLGAYSNFAEQQQIEETKIPETIEFNEYFQRWLTNHKNKNIPIEADQFRLYEEN